MCAHVEPLVYLLLHARASLTNLTQVASIAELNFRQHTAQAACSGTIRSSGQGHSCPTYPASNQAASSCTSGTAASDSPDISRAPKTPSAAGISLAATRLPLKNWQMQD